MKQTGNLLFGSLMAVLTLAGCSKGDLLPSVPKFTDRALRVYTERAPFPMGVVDRPVFDAFSQNIEDLGGVGDGVTDNTEAFARGMKSVSEKGGGHLVVPRGVWLTGPIVFEDNVDLHLKEGAVILFTDNYDAYPIVDTYFEGLKTRRCQSPISATGKTNIAITGFGTIDGNGDAWRWVRRSKVTAAQWQALLERGGCTDASGRKDAQGQDIDDAQTWFPTEAIRKAYLKADMNVVRGLETEAEWQAVRDYLRPVLVSLRYCRNVMLEGVCFQNSPAWNIHPFGCENVLVSGVMVINPWYSQNGDGLDIEACKDVLVVNSKFDVGDDAICVKSGKDKDGRDLGMPCQNIVVDGCAVYHGHGGFVVGSEMSGGVKNVSVSNCMFLGTDVGLRFKSARGRGGVVQNIHIDNVNMINIPTDCLLFDLHYTGLSASEAMAAGLDGTSADDEPVPPVTEETPQFRDIYISRITCRGAYRAMYFNGIPEMPISNVNITDARISSTYGIQLNFADSVSLQNVQLNIATGAPLTSNHVTNLTTDLQ